MQITPNTVKLISQNQKAHPLLSSPTLQILTIDKHINDNNQARIKAHLSDGSFYIKAIFSTKYTKHFDNAIKTNSLIKIESFEVRGKENVFVYVTEIADYCDQNEVIGNPISVSNRKESDKQGEVDRNEVFSRQNSIRNNERNESGSNRNNERNENIGNSNRNDYNNNTKNVTNARNENTAYNNNSNSTAHNNNNAYFIGDSGTKKSAPLSENFPPKTIDKPLSNPNLHPSKMHDKPHNEKLRKSLDNTDTKKQNTGITPISSINPFTNTYVIKGRCLSKSEIKTFKNQKGEGKLFSFVMADETGTIKVTAFSETVDMFYTLVDINKVYTISGGQVRMANKKFSNTTSEYEIHLEKSTKLNLVYDDATPKYYFKFVKMSDLIVNSSVDIVGVVKDVYEKGSVTIKSTGKEQSKRDLNLVDETGLVRTTLWGRNAEIEINQGDCLVLSNVLVREYNGISLSTSSSSTVHVNLMIDECYALKGWFEQIGKDIRFERKIKDTPKLISDIKEHEIKFSSFVGTVVFVKEDNLFYKSCVECNKKVVEEDGMFRCEKCNKTFDNCNLRYLARFEVGDFSDQIWVNAFDEQCKTMIGVEAKDIETENVKGLYCRDFMFKVMMKAENYQGETRNKYNVREVENVNYLNEAKRLIKAINDKLGLATHIEAYIQNLVIRKTLELVSLDYRRSLDDDCIGDDEIGRSIKMVCEPQSDCNTECAE